MFDQAGNDLFVDGWITRIHRLPETEQSFQIHKCPMPSLLVVEKTSRVAVSNTKQMDVKVNQWNIRP